MKLKEWLENLNEQVRNDPSILELAVITATDDEGNGFNRVAYTPEKGFYDGEDGFTLEKELESDDDKPNAVCLN